MPFISNWENTYEGSSAWIIGNGRSLLYTPPTDIKHHFNFSTNMLPKIYDTTNWRSDFYVVTGSAIEIPEYRPIIERGIKEARYHVFANREFVRGWKQHNMTRFTAYLRPVAFSKQPQKWMSRAGSSHFVTFQLAAWMGFSELRLIGFDLNYQPAEKGKDPNHFCNDYWADFHRNRVAADPEFAERTNRDHLRIHELTHRYCMRHNIRVIDCTARNNGLPYEKGDFQECLKQP